MVILNVYLHVSEYMLFLKAFLLLKGIVGETSLQTASLYW